MLVYNPLIDFYLRQILLIYSFYFSNSICFDEVIDIKRINSIEDLLFNSKNFTYS